LPLFDLDDVDAIARFILAQSTRCRYQPIGEIAAAAGVPARRPG
jgi:DNA-binding MurR/RpiR family transcriptional regulator